MNKKQLEQALVKYELGFIIFISLLLIGVLMLFFITFPELNSLREENQILQGQNDKLSDERQRALCKLHNISLDYGQCDLYNFWGDLEGFLDGEGFAYLSFVIEEENNPSKNNIAINFSVKDDLQTCYNESDGTWLEKNCKEFASEGGEE